jgi:putative SbcD/Mre11-related phosphoesterase
MGVEPLHDDPAALVDTGGERVLVIADYHAGIEVGLRREGVELESGAERRRRRLCGLVDRERVDRLVVLGDVGHAIGEPSGSERTELESLLEAVTERVPVTLVRGNHDGEVEPVVAGCDDASLVPGHGVRLGTVGFAHGHTWPDSDALSARTLCVGHEHPVVRLEDAVGGRRIERVWLRGGVDPAPFREHHGADLPVPDDIVVFPAFNDRSGGTRINVAGQGFLSPFLPDALVDGEAYLLDGARLGRYERV